MQNDKPLAEELSSKAKIYLILALCFIAASTMFVEIVIVKFIAFKVFHNFISVIVSTVVLSFAAAGTYLYMKRDSEASAQKTWRQASKEAAIYCILLMLSVVFFCWLPIDPYNRDLFVLWRIVSLPIYFVLFFCPFFFGGLCISRVLAESSLRPSRVLLFDLVAASIAAAFAPTCLELLGGYGAIGLAAFLGILSSIFFELASGDSKLRSISIKSLAFAGALALLLLYPGWAMNQYGMDIRTNKGRNLNEIVHDQLNGIKKTYWTALARIDVSGIGWSNKFAFLYGMAPNKENRQGRLINVDQGASTRQFVNDGNLSDQKYFGDSILATAYVVKPDSQDAVIIGGGGGLDVTVAKFFQVPRVKVLEMNPMMYKHVLLGEEDPDRKKFATWLESDQKTKVTILNKEARHFCSTAKPKSFDVIQATGVDTFTAVSSGALVYSDNYLYTYDAIDSYLRLLKPDGVLSLVYGREPMNFPLRLFTTYLACLESNGVEKPQYNVLVVGSDEAEVGSGLATVMLKPTPFTQEESDRIRDWCNRTGNTFIYDPKGSVEQVEGIPVKEQFYTRIAHASHQDRKKMIDDYEWNIVPATDDKPYVYMFEKDESWLFSSNYAYTPVLAVVLISLFSLVLIALPMTKLKSEMFSSGMLAQAFFFAMCGFSFLFFEVSIIQLFTIFVGGPMYSLAVVLVSVLAGYSVGCFIVGKLPVKAASYFAIGIVLFIVNMAAFLFLPEAIDSMLAFEMPLRIASCAAITIFMSALAGLPVPLAMEATKKKYKGKELAWFWGVNCAFNAMGAAFFPIISLQLGIRATLAVVASLYLIANLIFGFLMLKEEKLAQQ